MIFLTLCFYVNTLTDDDVQLQATEYARMYAVVHPIPFAASVYPTLPPKEVATMQERYYWSKYLELNRLLETGFVPPYKRENVHELAMFYFHRSYEWYWVHELQWDRGNTLSDDSIRRAFGTLYYGD